MGTANAEQVPVNVVGSSLFGIYPKISIEKTYNMYITQAGDANWLVNYAGYQLRSMSPGSGEGRGIFKSVRGNFLLSVIGANVYRYNLSLASQLVGTIGSFAGEVSIDENLNGQIVIVDSVNAYIYDYTATNKLTLLTLINEDSNQIVPNYVVYHNTFFLFASAPDSVQSSQWYAFEPVPSSSTTLQINSTMTLQTKPDAAIAVKRVPGKSNNVIVFGETVAEIWVQSGGPVAYTRVSSYNIDNGCVSVATIASNDEYVCWLGQNENNTPVILFSDGGRTQPISTDGIDNLLSALQFPQQSTAFFYRENGHVFYQLTFFNPVDNLSLIYDFNTKMFFHVSDENQNFYPARQVVYFNERNYFISINDSNLYEIGQEFITYNYNLDSTTSGEVIPRIRVCKTVRKEDSSTFRANRFTFWLEQGVNNYEFTTSTCDGVLIKEDGSAYIISEIGQEMLGELGSCTGPYSYGIRPIVDMAISKNGNQSFSQFVRRELNPQGVYRNIIHWHKLGQANEITVQLRFYGFQRYVACGGTIDIY